ncbi:UDP:flavonoid glycosyltransferase YjiC (YdhE family) [Streptomyces sp. 1114.5]|uniref:nucleotide disphospho-sugar-binding domain-containing protein n=1 Tax=unclassified Streptomyces TaxID=2593676 RepID=UPI000BDCB304|nr:MULTISPECIES: nucleotide disphospho-sugar-binding domain-containing protein [unclassified Streptomyces]RKT17055.1 UDP:flavonoid glycosyltransferase YjiC (YdhE family) [Streptomyces sp. 1114.5]SOB83266.1 UDP:flavonoid glycosyltransferase YjiC, YdhE family [Streptomyces sp. 1331.2]
MRVLVTASPGAGHTFATVPLTWALRAAGHEVLFATAGRLPGDLPAIVGAGVTVAEIASRERMAELRDRMRARTAEEARSLGISPAELAARHIDAARLARHVADGNGWAFASRIFGQISAATLDGLVEVATRWQPDLVVYETMQGGGPLVAALLGVPAVEHPIGFARGPEAVDAVAAALAAEYERYGVGRPARHTALDVCPPSMAVGPAYGLPMRYVPFNGGGSAGDWLFAEQERPRIAVTLGTVLPELGSDGFGQVVAAAARTDADFVLTADERQLAELGPLPPNVRGCGYVPLGALLRSCSAIVHHGGSSTTMTALDAGLPQLVIPHIADQFINAEAVRRRGCGLSGEDGSDLAGDFARLVGDDGLRTAAQQVRAELATLPSPADTADRLVRWASTPEDETEVDS